MAKSKSNQTQGKPAEGGATAGAGDQESAQAKTTEGGTAATGADQENGQGKTADDGATTSGGQDKKAYDNDKPKDEGSPVEALRITAKRDRFYRAGRKFGRTARVIATADLAEHEIAAIEGETALVVHRGEVEPDELTG